MNQANKEIIFKKATEGADVFFADEFSKISQIIADSKEGLKQTEQSLQPFLVENKEGEEGINFGEQVKQDARNMIGVVQVCRQDLDKLWLEFEQKFKVMKDEFEAERVKIDPVNQAEGFEKFIVKSKTQLNDNLAKLNTDLAGILNRVMDSRKKLTTDIIKVEISILREVIKVL